MRRQGSGMRASWLWFLRDRFGTARGTDLVLGTGRGLSLNSRDHSAEAAPRVWGVTRIRRTPCCISEVSFKTPARHSVNEEI